MNGSLPVVGTSVGVPVAKVRRGEDSAKSHFDFITNPWRATLHPSPLFDLPGALLRHAELNADLLQSSHLAVETKATGQGHEVTAPVPKTLKAIADSLDDPVARIAKTVLPHPCNLRVARTEPFEHDAEPCILTIDEGQQAINGGHSLT